METGKQGLDNGIPLPTASLQLPPEAGGNTEYDIANRLDVLFKDILLQKYFI